MYTTNSHPYHWTISEINSAKPSNFPHHQQMLQYEANIGTRSSSSTGSRPDFNSDQELKTRN